MKHQDLGGVDELAESVAEGGAVNDLEPLQELRVWHATLGCDVLVTLPILGVATTGGLLGRDPWVDGGAPAHALQAARGADVVNALLVVSTLDGGVDDALGRGCDGVVGELRLRLRLRESVSMCHDQRISLTLKSRMATGMSVTRTVYVSGL